MSSAESQGNSGPREQRQSASEASVKQPWLWNVVLLDDQDHTYDYVIRLAQELFGHTKEKALRVAEAVDSDGRAVLMTTHKELAELKREQVHAFGRDPLMATSKGSMGAIIEPAEFGGEDSADEGHGND